MPGIAVAACRDLKDQVKEMRTGHETRPLGRERQERQTADIGPQKL
ncbi:MAG: hypothetical protein WB729_04820 [Candidatus Sulfotelmatobacter sp.]